MTDDDDDRLDFNTPTPIRDELSPKDRVAYDASINGELTDDPELLDREIEILTETMSQLAGSYKSIDIFGLDKSSYLVLKTTGLLTSTSANAISLESFNQESSKEIVMESLTDSLKEKVAKWSAKIIAMAKAVISKTTSVLTPIYDRIISLSKTATDSGFKALSVAGKTIKAHPYKTILAALLAIAAVVGIITFITTEIPTGVVTNGMVDKFMTKLNLMFKNIKFPFGRIYTSRVLNDSVVQAQVELADNVVPIAQSVDKLGWTKTTFDAVVTQLTRNWYRFQSSMTLFFNKVIKPVEQVVSKILFLPKDAGDYVKTKTGLRTAGWAVEKVSSIFYYNMLSKLVINVYHLSVKVIGTTLHAITDSFRNLVASKA